MTLTQTTTVTIISAFKTTGPAVTTEQFVHITVFGELCSWILSSLVPSDRATEATFMSLDL